jgi:site-specific recombinase XerD
MAGMRFPGFVDSAYRSYVDALTQFKNGQGPRPAKQRQVSVPDVPNLSVLMEYTGALSWRSSYIDPMSSKRTSILHGSVAVMSLSEATAAHVALQAMVVEGRSPKASKLTVDHCFWHHVYPHSKATGKKSIADDVAKYRNEFQATMGSWPIGRVTPHMLRQEAERIRAKKNSSTAEHYVAFIRSLFRDLVELGLLATNPALGLKIRQIHNPRLVIATDEQLKRIGSAMAFDGPSSHNDFFMGLMMTGARVSELLNAKFSDVDEAAGILHLSDSKSGGPQTIVLPLEFLPILKRRQAARVSEYLFPSEKGNSPMSYPWRAFQRLLKRADVAGLTMHDFRRGFGTAGIQSEGVTVHDVSKLLRHSSTRVTEQHYLVAVDNRLQRAANQASQSIAKQLRKAIYEILKPSVRSVAIDLNVAFVTASSRCGLNFFSI